MSLIISSYFTGHTHTYKVASNRSSSAVVRRRAKKLNCLTLLFNDVGLEKQVKSSSVTLVDIHLRNNAVLPVCAVAVPLLGRDGFAPLHKLHGFGLRYHLRRPDARL